MTSGFGCAVLAVVFDFAHGNFRLASAMGRARLGAVNSICGLLIVRFAFETSISTNQQVLEETQASVILGKAIDAVPDESGMSELQSTARRLGLDEDWNEDLQSLVTCFGSRGSWVRILPPISIMFLDFYLHPDGLDVTVRAPLHNKITLWQHRFTTLTFWSGQIGEIRPLIQWGLRGAFFDPFCYGANSLVGVAENTALVAE